MRPAPHRDIGQSPQKEIREVSLYVITYENPYVVRAGERGQLSYVNLSTDFRRKALSYVGSSVGLFEIFFRIFRICPWQHSSRAKHKVHTPYTTCKISWKTRFRFMVHAVGACSQRVSKATTHVDQSWRNHVERNRTALIFTYENSVQFIRYFHT